jgi:RimJ/RimL family protein N-acetyltransferase
LHSARLRLRQVAPDDAAFILELLTEPDWQRYIGDRGVHDLPSALRYIEQGPCAMYAREGFGLWLVETLSKGDRIGLCGLLRRAGLEDVDLGFALLERYRGQGFAFEAASRVLAHGRDVLRLPRIVAITLPANLPSCRLLERLGMRCERLLRLPGEQSDVALYA